MALPDSEAIISLPDPKQWLGSIPGRSSSPIEAVPGSGRAPSIPARHRRDRPRSSPFAGSLRGHGCRAVRRGPSWCGVAAAHRLRHGHRPTARRAVRTGTDAPLSAAIIFTLGPVPITEPVLVTWGLMTLLVGGSALLTRSLSLHPSRTQAVLELVVDLIEAQISDTAGGPARRFVPLIGTLFLFILTANWSSLIPGVEPPTAHLETDAALAAIVFAATLWFGISRPRTARLSRDVRGPQSHHAALNVMEMLTRTFSLIVRLFGNVMSGVFVVG